MARTQCDPLHRRELDGGRLVVAHAGMKQEMQGRGSGRVRDFALYGETTDETARIDIDRSVQPFRLWHGGVEQQSPNRGTRPPNCGTPADQIFISLSLYLLFLFIPLGRLIVCRS